MGLWAPAHVASFGIGFAGHYPCMGNPMTQAPSAPAAVTTDRWTADNMPDQHGRVAVVTGANSGLGFEAAKALAESGASVVLAVRDVSRGQQAAARIAVGAPDAEVSVQQLDLASLGSVRAAAADVLAAHPRIDLLINNAGVMAPPKQVTVDGFELQLATNHLGHFAFTGLLLDPLLEVAGSRVVTVSSLAHDLQARINFDDLQSERSYNRMAAYGQSKLANLLFTYELQRRLDAAGKSTIAVAAHPGVADTDLFGDLPGFLRPIVAVTKPFYTQSPAMGALPTLRAATDPDVVGGQYYGPGGIRGWRGLPKLVTSNARSHDVDVQRRLWAISEELTGVHFSF